MEFKDQIGNLLSFEKKPRRIISLVPCISETLYDLNLEEFVIGITSNCVHPAHFRPTKNSVGTPKEIDIDKIKALQPDIIFCNQGENTLETITALKKIAQVYVTDVKNIEDSQNMIRQFGALLNRRTEADLLNRKITLKLQEFQNYTPSISVKKISYFVGYQPWMVAANSTYINAMLQLCKFDNIYNNLNDYPIISPQRIRFDGDPELLFFSSEPFPFKDKHAFEISEYTNRSGAVFVDGQMFGWFGSRTLKALDYFKVLREKIENSPSFLK